MSELNLDHLPHVCREGPEGWPVPCDDRCPLRDPWEARRLDAEALARGAA